MQHAGFFGLALTILGLSAAYVLFPLFNPKRSFKPTSQGATGENPSLGDSHGPRDELELEQVLEQRDIAYSNLVELEQEFSAGDLNASDYQELRSRYMQEAVEALQQFDQLETRHNQLDLEVEAAVGEIKDRIRQQAQAVPAPGPKSSAVVNGVISKLKPTLSSVTSPQAIKSKKIPVRQCRTCRHPSDHDAIYCTHCGSKLPPLMESEREVI